MGDASAQLFAALAAIRSSFGSFEAALKTAVDGQSASERATLARISQVEATYKETWDAAYPLIITLTSAKKRLETVAANESALVAAKQDIRKLQDALTAERVSYDDVQKRLATLEAAAARLPVPPITIDQTPQNVVPSPTGSNEGGQNRGREAVNSNDDGNPLSQ